MQQRFYLYFYYDPRNNEPFYVGIGRMQSTRHSYHLKVAQGKWNCRDNNTLKLNKIKSILKCGLEPRITLMFENLLENDAKNLEKSYIKLFGRLDQKTGILTNLTDGGDGNVNWTPSQRKKISDIQKNKISAKDKEGNRIKVDKTDPRWLSGELVGQTKGTVNSNINGKLDRYILAKNSKEEVFRVKPDDSRWISGELVGFNKNRPAHPNTIAAAKLRKGSKKNPDSVKRGADKIRNVPKSKEQRELISATMKNKPDIVCKHCNRILRPSSLGIHMKKRHPEHWIPAKSR